MAFPKKIKNEIEWVGNLQKRFDDLMLEKRILLGLQKVDFKPVEVPIVVKPKPKAIKIKPRKPKLAKIREVVLKKVRSPHVFDNDMGMWVSRSEGPPSPFENGYGFLKALTKRGFKILGRGYFSAVCHKPGTTRVLKVGIRPSEGDGWSDYMFWGAKKGYAGTFVPKVYSYKWVKGKKSDFYIASMEKLDSEMSNFGSDHANTVIANLIEYGAKYNNELGITLADLAVPGLGKFCTSLAAHFVDSRLDLHGANIMTRHDGSLVVIDAVAGHRQGTTIPKRLKTADFEMAAAA